MSEYFLIADLFQEINSSIPIFKIPSGHTIKIKLTKANNNAIHFVIDVLNNRNEGISLGQLDEFNLAFFINEYRQFISRIDYKKTKTFVSVVRSLKRLLSKREFSIFVFLSSADLPFLVSYEIFSFEGTSQACFARIKVKQANIGYIFNASYSNIQVWHLGALNLNLILRFVQHENEFSIQIIEKFLSYLRKIIILVIVFLNVWLLYFDDFSKFQISRIFYGIFFGLEFLLL